MRIVIDTNRLMAGLLKDSLVRAIILHDMFDFYAPDYILVELEKHHTYLCEKAKLTDEDFHVILYTLMENIELVPYELFEEYMDESSELMKDIDVKDSPFIAVGIAIRADGIWTEDKHFYKQNRLRVYSTKDLANMLWGIK